MTCRFLAAVRTYWQQARNASARTQHALSRDLWSSADLCLPPGTLFQPLRTPARNLDSPECRTFVQTPPRDLFYVDVLGDGGVLEAGAFRAHCRAVLADAAESALLWFVTETRSGVCLSMLHLRHPRTARYVEVRSCFIVDECLTCPRGDTACATAYECLLLHLVAFADHRNLDVRLAPPPSVVADRVPLFALLLALLGFLRAGDRVVRTPLYEMTGSADVLAAVEGQMARTLAIQFQRLTADQSQSTPGAAAPAGL